MLRYFKRWMKALLWYCMIYLCSRCTSCNNRRQVHPQQHKWDELTLPLSLAGFRASSWTDLLPPSHWCQMKDECRDMKTTTTRHFIALFFFSSMTSQHNGQEHSVKCREVWDLIVYISCQISQSVSDLPHPVRLQSYSCCPFSVMISRGNTLC